MTVTRTQCHPETGFGGSKNNKGLSVGIVPEQVTTTGCARICRLLKQTGDTLRHTISGNGATLTVAIPHSYEFDTSGVSKK